ncbi:MAG: VWA domain-containing protein [Chloroflexaceae bacterium]|nr:VWA domain-containing protein [Chloroflexaceae bacterium]
MTFLTPLIGLAALLALPIIVLLHLRRERLRRVLVPSLLLWQNIPQTTGKRRKMLLPMTLLLLLHLLAAGFLALALTQPQWLAAWLNEDRTHTAVILDISTSMAARENTLQTRLDLARDQVRQLIDELGPEDQLSLIVAGTEASLVATGGSDDRASLLATLDAIEAGGTGTSLPEALTLARVAIEERRGVATPGSRIVVISDLEAPPTLAQNAEQLTWQRVGGTTSNIAIVGMTALPRRDGSHDVYARVVNYDNQAYGLGVLLYGDDEVLDTRPVRLPANGEADLTWNIASTPNVLRAELNLEDALNADNVAYASLMRNRSVRVVLVSSAPDQLSRVLRAIPGASVEVVAPADYTQAGTLGTADLTILDTVLPTTLPAGGVLIINPPASPEGNAALAVSDQRVEAAAGAVPSVTVGGNEALETLSLGGVEFGALAQVTAPAWLEPHLMLGDAPLILSGQNGNSSVTVWTFDIQRSTIIERIAFPVLTALTVRDLLPAAPTVDVLLGQPLEMRPHPRTTSVELVAPDGQTRQFPISQTVLTDGLYQPGIYTLREQAGAEVVFEGSVAVNAGTPLESNLQARALQTLTPAYVAADVPAATIAAEERTERPIWPWLAGLALLVLLLEWIYIHVR